MLKLLECTVPPLKIGTSMSIIHTHIPRSRSKRSKSASVIAADAALRATLARCGYKGGSKNVKGSYSSNVSHRDYSNDIIPANGAAKRTNSYTGTELAGIATMQKSNAVPIRRDNKSAAIDIAAMRR
jgi:hypothetical protein